MKRTTIFKSIVSGLVMFGLLIGLSLQFLITPKAFAAALPAGGGELESAAAITAGTYSVGALTFNQSYYYSVSVKAGQELAVTGTFKVVAENEQYGTLNTIEIFSGTKESVVSKFEDSGTPIVVAALADSSASTHTFYIRISDDTWGTESGELTVALNDRFDANSGTDAGDGFDNALATTAGDYTGYLSQIDYIDYYTISAAKGNVSAKVTPAKDTIPEVKIFDVNRKNLADEFSANEGEIITASADITTDQKIYISVKCNYGSGCNSAATKYSLTISNGGAIVTDGDLPELLDFGTVVPVVPTGDAAKIDTIVRPPLEKTFNNIKSKEATRGKVVYVVEREIKTADLEAIKAAMEALGYKTKSSSAAKLEMTKGFKQITFQAVAGSNQITVTSKFVMNWLYAGIIAAAVVLIIILIIVLVVKRKKSASASASAPASSAAPAPSPAPAPAPEAKPSSESKPASNTKPTPKTPADSSKK